MLIPCPCPSASTLPPRSSPTKLEEYECVKTKRRAQARTYEQTNDFTPEQLVAHYQHLGETARLRQAELRARAQSAA